MSRHRFSPFTPVAFDPSRPLCNANARVVHANTTTDALLEKEQMRQSCRKDSIRVCMLYILLSNEECSTFFNISVGVVTIMSMCI